MVATISNYFDRIYDKKKANLTPKIYLKTTGYIMTDMIKISHIYNKPRDIRIGILERAEQENKYQLKQTKEYSEYLIKLKKESSFLYFLKQVMSFWQKDQNQ